MVAKALSKMYSIEFKGLSQGKHSFTFDLDDKFFAKFEGSEFSRGQLRADVLLIKGEQLLELQTTIAGTIEVTCDRCLELFDLPLSYQGTLYVKIGKAGTSTDDDIMFIDADEYQIDLAQYLYESVCLSVPIRRYHGVNGTNTGDCDAEMLKRLSTNATKSSPVIDERWNKLKALTNN